MIGPSPNEFERLKNEEFVKRRILRLKEVREHSKANASRLRHLYKEQKAKVIDKIAENIQIQLNSDASEEILNLKGKYNRQCDALGDGHNNVSEWVDPMIAVREKGEINKIIAQDRHDKAVCQLKIDNEERDFVKNSRLESLNMAQAVEKERALAVAALPPPIDPFYNPDLLRDAEDMIPRVKVCDRNKFSVIESYETFSYNVQRLDGTDQEFEYGASNAMDAGEMRQRHLAKIGTNEQMECEEQSIKAQLRGHQAIRKQIVQKDYGELLTNLEHISKGEMAKRQREYHKNELVGPNSAGHLGIGHTAAMVGYKERCRERAVESAVMESLKDITNKASLSKQNILKEDGEGRPETKLMKLYDIIRKQKENVASESTEDRETKRLEVHFDKENGEREESLSRGSHRDDIEDGVVDLQRIEKGPSNEDYTRDILKNAAAAAIKSGSVLEKFNSEKERNTIEKKIQYLDRRLEQIKEVDTNGTGSISSRESARSVIYGLSRFDVNQSSSRSEDLRGTLSSESVCSDSLNIIREFQRQALMKISGHPCNQSSINPLHTLGRQLSDLSLDSSSATSRVSIHNISGGRNTTLEASSGSHSSVNEWVKTQLIQTIDRIPDWVTRTGTEPQFLPDLNMSFMSSILNIRSGASSTKDDSQSSCSTVLTHSSVLRHTERSSITEISRLNTTMEPGNSLSQYRERESDSCADVSGHFDKSISSVKLNEYISEKNSSSTQNQVDVEGGIRSRYRLMSEDGNNNAEIGARADLLMSCEDLINFQSVEDLTKEEENVSDEESSYQRALKELMIMTDRSDLRCPTESNGPDSQSTVPAEEEDKPLSHVYDLQDIDLTIGTGSSTRSENHIINDYESFLSGLLKKPLISPSITCKDLSDDRTDAQSFLERRSSSNPSVDRDGSGEILSENIEKGNEQRQIITGGTKVSFFTSTVREDQPDPALHISLSPIQCFGAISDHTLIYEPQSDRPENVDSSRGSMKELSPYSSDSNETATPSSRMHSHIAIESEGHEEEQQKHREKIRQILSSTMKPDRRNVRISSPDISSISSISSEACNRLKQRIMLEYFEKNRGLLSAEVSGTKSSDLSMKPMESFEDSTPRNPDSGKASSRLTQEHSEQMTGRLTNEDYFMTPRSDNNWTEYTPRDEWSSPHSQFQVLQDYVSSGGPGESYYDDTMEKVDLDATLKNEDEATRMLGSYNSVNLIDFESYPDVNVRAGGLNEDRVLSQSLSDNSGSQLTSEGVQDEDIPSKESSSEGNKTSFQVLESYHSLSESPCHNVQHHGISDLEDTHHLFTTSLMDNSMDARSDADTSSISLASFLKNESFCQQEFTTEETSLETSTPKRVPGPSQPIDNNEEMKSQLARWKKERLTRINQHPLEATVGANKFVTKTGPIRKDDEIEKKSRTLRLYNNLDEVQKMKQKKEAEQRTKENQLKKKEYAEKLRRLKKERSGNSKH